MKSMPHLVGEKNDKYDVYLHVFPASIKLENSCLIFNSIFDDAPFHVNDFAPWWNEFPQTIIPLFNVAEIEIDNYEREICETEEELEKAIEKKAKRKARKKK